MKRQPGRRGVHADARKHQEFGHGLGGHATTLRDRFGDTQQQWPSPVQPKLTREPIDLGEPTNNEILGGRNTFPNVCEHRLDLRGPRSLQKELSKKG
jgi:hypothetical protein